MRALPEAFDAGALTGVLADDWGFNVEAAEYARVGGGSYHWVVRDRHGSRGFVTVDDLDWKPWLGSTRVSVLDGLTRAFDTALALRDGGLDFVVAPIPTARARRCAESRHATQSRCSRSWMDKRGRLASTTPPSARRS